VRQKTDRVALNARGRVLRLLARGLANKEIARDLSVTEKTAKAHVSGILGKLGLQSRTQAALYAGRIGLLPIDELGAEPTRTTPPHSGPSAR
jgi:two-component system, NarL family, response regulator LiaR